MTWFEISYKMTAMLDLALEKQARQIFKFKLN